MSLLASKTTELLLARGGEILYAHGERARSGALPVGDLYVKTDNI